MPQRKSPQAAKPHSSSKNKPTELNDRKIAFTSTRRRTGSQLKISKEPVKSRKPGKESRDVLLQQRGVDVVNFNSDDDPVDVTQHAEEDDEEAWLDALEKGDLDDYGELKKEKDPSMMTARQRALKERTSILSSKSFANVTLLGGGTKARIMTEEAQKRKEEKNKRRKLQAVKKAEESQKQTIERLIKQQGVRNIKERQKKPNQNGENGATQQQPDLKSAPMIKYVSKGSLITLSYPKEMECPIKAKSSKFEHKDRPSCVICGNPKKYSCSRTKRPLCSLQCYKMNLVKT